jgi:antitoxin (DNA-binding transcriptional repressor) of toxin-antitoxin stability system
VLQTISVEQAEGHLAEVIERLTPGEEFILTRNSQPVARLIVEGRPPRTGPGLGKGMLTIVADDEDHLKDFVESMP